MIREGHIGAYEMTALLSLAVGARVFLGLPEIMVKLGTSAGWMVPLLAALLTLPPYYLYCRLLCRFPGESIVTVAEKVWGRWLVAPILFAVWLNTIAVAGLTLRQFNETFITVALPQTPISVLVIVQVAVLSYASYLGLETIARTSFLVLPWIVAAIALILSGVIPYARSEHLAPFWGPGPLTLLKHGLLRTSMFIEVMIIGALAPSIRRSKDLLPIGLFAILGSSLMYAATTAMNIMVASTTGASEIPYPLYVLARHIYFGRFFQRAEAIFIIVWFIAASGSLFVTFHVAILIVADYLRLPFYQPLIFPTGIIVFVATLIPRSFSEARYWDAWFLRQYTGSGILVIVMLTYLVAVVRKLGTPQRQAEGDEEPERGNGG